MPQLRGEIAKKVYAAFKNGPMSVFQASNMLALEVTQVGPPIYSLSRRGLLREAQRSGRTKIYERTPEHEVMAGVVRTTKLSHDIAALAGRIAKLEQHCADLEQENKRLRRALRANVEAYKELGL